MSAGCPTASRCCWRTCCATRTARATRWTTPKSIAGWLPSGHSEREVPFRPARILLQDFTGVPAVVDLAAMRDGIIKLGGDPRKINPLLPVDLVIDHSVMVDDFGTAAGAAAERRHRIRAERRALRVPPLGPVGVRQFPRRAAGHRHLPPGEPGIPGAVVWTSQDTATPSSTPTAARHRQPHHHGQRPRRARLGRRRDRGGGGHARPADRHADPRRHRLQADRQAAAKASPPPTWC